MKKLRLGVNIDHVATLRNARGGEHPCPIRAALLAKDAGADGITAHLREDRRHMQDDDIVRLTREVRTVFNLEMAATDEMVRIACELKPYQITLVPERREEVTTEGGLDVASAERRLVLAIPELHASGTRVSLFIDPDPAAIAIAARLGVAAIELHTGQYAAAYRRGATADALAALATAARLGRSLGLAVHAGHGLTVGNVGAVASIPEIEELNIGHSIVSRAIFVGLREAIGEMRVAMDAGRSSHYAESRH
jgi:pyridoxine 5-phosphate synthase